MQFCLVSLLSQQERFLPLLSVTLCAVYYWPFWERNISTFSFFFFYEGPTYLFKAFTCQSFLLHVHFQPGCWADSPVPFHPKNWKCTSLLLVTWFWFLFHVHCQSVRNIRKKFHTLDLAGCIIFDCPAEGTQNCIYHGGFSGQEFFGEWSNKLTTRVWQ